MKKFLVRLSIFLIGIVSIVITYHVFFNLLYNSKDKENAVFIWGDSQAYQGIDLERLSEKSGLNVYSAAKHGAGVYDFLVFAKNVPEKSKVLVSFSKPVLLRKKEHDYNSSGLSITSLIDLFMNNYSFNEVMLIFKNNYKTYKKLYSSSSNLYPVTENIYFTEPLELLKDDFRRVPNFLRDKEKLYYKGIDILKKKKCQINTILFPFDSILYDIERQSPIRFEINRAQNRIQNKINCSVENFISLEKDYRTMYDLTHLNQYGARQVSDFLSLTIKEDINHFYVVKH